MILTSFFWLTDAGCRFKRIEISCFRFCLLTGSSVSHDWSWVCWPEIGHEIDSGSALDFWFCSGLVITWSCVKVVWLFLNLSSFSHYSVRCWLRIWYNQTDGMKRCFHMLLQWWSSSTFSYYVLTFLFPHIDAPVGLTNVSLVAVKTLDFENSLVLQVDPHFW